MADAKMITKEQLKCVEEMKQKVDQHGDLLSAEDRAFLADHIDSSLRACKLYLQLEEEINKKPKTAETEVKQAEPEKAEAEAKPKKKAAPKKKKEATAEQGSLLPEEPAKEAVPEPAKEETAETEALAPTEEAEPVKEEPAELDLDDLLG